MRKALALIVSTVAACVALPAATAQAAPACGTTPDQWVGYFPGFTHWGGTAEDTPLDHTITSRNGVLVVDTLINDWKRLQPVGDPTLDGNSLSWYTRSESGQEENIYTTTAVSCADGKVQSFSGTDLWRYFIPVWWHENETEFSASRG